MPEPATVVTPTHAQLAGSRRVDGRDLTVVVRRGDRPFRRGIDAAARKIRDSTFSALVGSARQVEIIDHELVIIHGAAAPLAPWMTARLGAARPLSVSAAEYAPIEDFAVFQHASGVWFLAEHGQRDGTVRSWLARGGIPPAPIALPANVGYLMFVPSRSNPTVDEFTMQVGLTNDDVLSWTREATIDDAERSYEISIGSPPAEGTKSSITRSGRDVFSVNRRSR